MEMWRIRPEKWASSAFETPLGIVTGSPDRNGRTYLPNWLRNLFRRILPLENILWWN